MHDARQIVSRDAFSPSSVAPCSAAVHPRVTDRPRARGRSGDGTLDGVTTDLADLRVAADPGFERRAEAWAARLGAPLAPTPARFELHLGPAGLGVRPGHGPGATAAPLVVDLARRRSGAETVVRAVRGKRAARGLHVVDATAGLGGDAAAMARAGMRVTMIERDPLLAALLEDALARWTAEGGATAGEDGGGLTLARGDARDRLAEVLPRPDVVYLDPMYPRLGGGAKRRGAAWLRAWTGERGDADDEADRALLALACGVALRRVVVKRPLKAPPLAPGPSGALRGTTTRFDLYAPDPSA